MNPENTTLEFNPTNSSLESVNEREGLFDVDKSRARNEEIRHKVAEIFLDTEVPDVMGEALVAHAEDAAKQELNKATPELHLHTLEAFEDALIGGVDMRNAVASSKNPAYVVDSQDPSTVEEVMRELAARGDEWHVVERIAETIDDVTKELQQHPVMQEGDGGIEYMSPGDGEGQLEAHLHTLESKELKNEAVVLGAKGAYGDLTETVSRPSGTDSETAEKVIESIEPNSEVEMQTLSMDQLKAAFLDKATTLTDLARRFREGDSRPDEIVALRQIVDIFEKERQTKYAIEGYPDESPETGAAMLMAGFGFSDDETHDPFQLDVEKLEAVTEAGSVDALRLAIMSGASVAVLRSIGLSTYGEPINWPKNQKLQAVNELSDLFSSTRYLHVEGGMWESAYRNESAGYREQCIASVEDQAADESDVQYCDRLQSIGEALFSDDLGLPPRVTEALIASITTRQLRGGAEGDSSKWSRDVLMMLDKVKDVDRTARLYSEFNILNFGQCSEVLLDRMNKVAMGDEVTLESLRTHDVTLMIRNSLGDHNGAMGKHSDVYEKAGDTGILLYGESSRPEDLVRLPLKLQKKWGIQPTSVVINAHGHPGGFTIGDGEETHIVGTGTLPERTTTVGKDYDISKAEFRGLTERCMRDGSDGQKHIIFLSCSLAREPAENVPSFVEAMSHATGAVTWGAAEDLNISVNTEGSVAYHTWADEKSSMLPKPQDTLRFETASDGSTLRTAHDAIKSSRVRNE